MVRGRLEAQLKQRCQPVQPAAEYLPRTLKAILLALKSFALFNMEIHCFVDENATTTLIYPDLAGVHKTSKATHLVYVYR